MIRQSVHLMHRSRHPFDIEPCPDTGPPLDLTNDVTPAQLNTLLNTLLENDEKLPYSFYINDKELAGELGDHIKKNAISVESSLQVVFQPQALFRVRPVTRLSSSISGLSTCPSNA